MTKEYTVLSLKKISQLNDLTDLIVYVRYKVMAYDGKNTVLYQGDCKLPIPESNYIPFEDLTEELVITWVRNNINEDKLDELLASLLFRQKYNYEDCCLPWDAAE